MNYEATLNWMFKQLPMYQRKGKTAFKKDLSNTLKLASHLGHPEIKIKTIHVGGTNGKGSCSHMLASVLQQAGYKVGLYTSPHLKDFRERIKINGTPINEASVIDFIANNKPFLEANNLSFFEMTVGMALWYFAEQNVDVAIVEVGLGGRLDSTNIITPELSVITNIGLDHTAFLGDTLALIASEKAGIIKQNIPVVIGETQPETQPIFTEKAKATNSEITFADQSIKTALPSDLKGSYQAHNIKTVMQSVGVLRGLGYAITAIHLKQGLLKVAESTGLQGRWQVLQTQPKLVCDTAHNKEGLRYTMQQVAKESYTNLHIVFGVVSDKDVESILHLLPKTAQYYLCKPNVPRGMPVDTLATYFNSNGYKHTVYNSVTEAKTVALQNAQPTDFIYIGGSTFVVAEVIP